MTNKTKELECEFNLFERIIIALSIVSIPIVIFCFTIWGLK